MNDYIEITELVVAWRKALAEETDPRMRAVIEEIIGQLRRIRDDQQ